MARLLLKPHYSSRHYISLLRITMSSSSSSSPVTWSHSFSSLSCPSVFLKTRVSFPLRTVPSRFSVQNGVAPRAFMSTSTATESNKESSSSKGYGSDQIQVLKGLEPVRKRPGMYIGSTGPRGLHHLVYEILDNAVDEAQAGYASKITVVLHSDNSVSITDNGRGIPTDLHPVTKKSSLETVLTVLHAGGKFGGSNSGYSVSGGLHGVGLSVVNALSEELEVTVWRDGKEYQQKYSRGNPVTTLMCYELSAESKDHKGTRIRFWPDKEVFTTEIQLDYNTIGGRVRELAFLNPKLTISLKKEDNDPEKNQYDEHFYAGGLVEYVDWLNTDKGEMQQLRDKLAVAERAAKAEAQLKDKYQLRFKVLEERLKASNGNSRATPEGRNTSNGPSRRLSLGGVENFPRSSFNGYLSRKASNSQAGSLRSSSAATLVRHARMSARSFDGGSRSLDDKLLVGGTGKDNAPASDQTQSTERIEIVEIENGTSTENSKSEHEDQVSGVLYDMLQKDVITLRKACHEKDQNLKDKDDAIEMLAKKVDTLNKAMEAEAKKMRREVAARVKEVAAMRVNKEHDHRTRRSSAPRASQLLTSRSTRNSYALDAAMRQ